MTIKEIMFSGYMLERNSWFAAKQNIVRHAHFSSTGYIACPKTRDLHLKFLSITNKEKIDAIYQCFSRMEF